MIIELKLSKKYSDFFEYLAELQDLTVEQIIIQSVLYLYGPAYEDFKAIQDKKERSLFNG